MASVNSKSLIYWNTLHYEDELLKSVKRSATAQEIYAIRNDVFEVSSTQKKASKVGRAIIIGCFFLAWGGAMIGAFTNPGVDYQVMGSLGVICVLVGIDYLSSAYYERRARQIVEFDEKNNYQKLNEFYQKVQIELNAAL